MATRMVYSTKDGNVCGFAWAATYPISVYPGGHAAGEQISVCWSLTLDNAKKLAANLLEAVAAVESASPSTPCPRCGSETGVQLQDPAADGCTACFSTASAGTVQS